MLVYASGVLDKHFYVQQLPLQINSAEEDLRKARALPDFIEQDDLMGEVGSTQGHRF